MAFLGVSSGSGSGETCKGSTAVKEEAEKMEVDVSAEKSVANAAASSLNEAPSSAGQAACTEELGTGVEHMVTGDESAEPANVAEGSAGVVSVGSPTSEAKMEVEESVRGATGGVPSPAQGTQSSSQKSVSDVARHQVAMSSGEATTSSAAYRSQISWPEVGWRRKSNV